MAGCFRCPVNCRPLNEHEPDPADRYGRGDGPEYVTLGKFGPNIGVDRIESVIRLNNICNDLGFDTASTGSAIAWAMELFSAASSRRAQTGGLDLTWGNAEAVEQLLFLMSRARGFRQRHRRQHARRREGALSGRGAEVPDGGEGADAERSARRADPEGVRARARGRDARDGSPAQPRHARDQRAHQRRSRVQGAALRRPGQRGAEQLRATRSARSASARTPTRSATASACAASRRSCSTARRCPASRSSRTRSATSPACSSRETELDAIGHNIMGVERLINAPPRRPPRARHAAGSLVRRADHGGPVHGRADRSRRVRRDAVALLRDLATSRRRDCRVTNGGPSLRPYWGERRPERRRYVRAVSR